MKRIVDWVWQRLPSAAAWAWQWLAAAGKALWKSVKALVASPAVWLACALVFAVGFSAGHLERSRVVKTLQGERAELMAEIDGLSMRVRTLTGEVAKARQEAADARKAAPAPEPPRTAERPPAARRAPAKRLPKPTPTPAIIWNPFSG